MKLGFLLGAAVLTTAASSLIGAAPPEPNRPQTNAGGAPDLTLATFLNPPRTVRPFYRWWLPLAAVDGAELGKELDEMLAAGAGGAEVDAMPVPAPIGASDRFLERYGFGTPAWSKAFETIYREGLRRGLTIDFMASPLYPTTVPSLYRLNDPAAQQRLTFGFEQVQPGATRHGALPKPTNPVMFATSLCSTAAPGSTTLSVEASGGFSAGDVVRVGAGDGQEAVRIASVQFGSSAVCSTLAADAHSGGSRLSLPTAPPNLLVGTILRVGAGSNAEHVSVRAVEVGKNGATIEFFPALRRNHTESEAVTSGKSGLLAVAALARDHSAGSPVVDEAKRTTLTVLAARCATAECPVERGVRMLDPKSIREVTSAVNSDGHLDWTAPTDGNPWWLIAFYQSADGQTVSDSSASRPSYVIDHIGVAGASALTDYYDRSILTPAAKAAIRRMGTASLFEDSYEPGDGLKWTWAFLEEFSRRRGYDLKLLLPAVAATDVGARHPAFDIPDGERVREDYRQTWSDLYLDNHVGPYNRWAHNLGLKTRMQVEGGPMEVAEIAAHVDIPEGENRNFLNNPELWKVIGIGAQFRAHEAILSDECCPIQNGTWATTAGGKPYTVAQGTGAPYGQAGNDANLNWIYKAYAGGVNQLVWHGFPYFSAPAGSGERARWPGNSFDGNAAGFSESFGPQMPQWQDQRTINDHLARLQLVLRQGRPRYDVAVFWHDFGVNGIVPNLTPYTGYPGLSRMFDTTSGLAKAGYTYQYAAPGFFRQLRASDATSGELDPTGLGFRAIVLNAQEVMPLESLRRIRDLAKTARFPVVIAGKLPRRVPGLGSTDDDAAVASLSEELRALASGGGSVALVANASDVPAALHRLGVTPDAEHLSDPNSSDILAVHRRTANTDYYFLLNQDVARSRQTLSFKGAGTPLELDTWSGTVVPLAQFKSHGDRVELPLDIGANDVKVIAISRKPGRTAATGVHAIESEGKVRFGSGGLKLRALRPGLYRTTLSDGRQITIRVDDTLPGVIIPASWSLVVESWTPDASGLPGLEHTVRRTLPPIEVRPSSDGLLPSWAELRQADKAGFGFYETTIRLPTRWRRGFGALLDLGTVVDTFRIEVNGRLVPPSSYQDTSSIDIGSYLRPGTNRLAVRVATPLRNAVETATHGGAKLLTTYGLRGPVMIRPYNDLPIGVDAARRRQRAVGR